MNAQKTKFPTSQQVYNQIKWDGRFDATGFEMVYTTRRDEQKSKPLPSWDPAGDVPWHRVVAITFRGQVVWDRHARHMALEQVLEQEDLAAADEPGEFEPRLAYVCDPGTGLWREADAQGLGPAPCRLHVVTWNVLFDLYDVDPAFSPSRWPSLCAMLRGLAPDVMVLEEVTEAFATVLLAQPWVKRRYWVSDLPSGASLHPYGQLILSAHPMSVHLLTLSPYKRAVLGRLRWQGAPGVSVCGVHLPSGRTEEAGARRQQQLERVLCSMEGEADALVVGDFNLGEEESTQLLAQAKFTDIWHLLHPGDPGHTYRPSWNAVAKMLSSSGIDARYDRMQWKHGGRMLLPESIQRIGTCAIGPGLFASDHDGLSCWFRVGAEEHLGAPVVTSACAVLLEERSHGPVQQLRREHDRSVARWMPHINLLYPFVPAGAFGQVAPRLSKALREVEPFEIELGSFDTFAHAKSHTVWLSPEPAGPLIALERVLKLQVPGCAENGERGGQGYTPHLTVGQFRRDEVGEMRACMASWQLEWPGVRSFVSEVALMSRDDGAPFSVQKRLPLGQDGGIEGVLWDVAQQEDRSGETLWWMERLEPVIGQLGAQFQDVGSTCLGTALPGSDLDVVVWGEEEELVGLRKLSRALAQAKGVSKVVFVDDAKAPVVRARLGGRSADFLWARVGSDGEFVTGQRAVSALEMAAFLGQRIQGSGAPVLVTQAIKVLKMWAISQQIYGTAWGYWGGVSWTLALLWSLDALMTQRPGVGLSVHGVLSDCFERLATWSWPHPVDLLGQAALHDAPSAHMPVMNPVRPGENTTRSMTPSTAAVMKEAFGVAWAGVCAIGQGAEVWRAVVGGEKVWGEGEWVVVMECADEGLMAQTVVGVVMGLEPLGQVRPLPEPVRPGRWHLVLRTGGRVSQERVVRHVGGMRVAKGVTLRVEAWSA